MEDTLEYVYERKTETDQCCGKARSRWHAVCLNHHSPPCVIVWVIACTEKICLIQSCKLQIQINTYQTTYSSKNTDIQVRHLISLTSLPFLMCQPCGRPHGSGLGPFKVFFWTFNVCFLRQWLTSSLTLSLSSLWSY